MTREEIINGLKMSMELTLFDPSTGEVMEPQQLNDINRTAYETYKGAIELLEKQPDMSDYCDRLWKLAYERGKAERKKGRWIESNPQNSKLCRLMTCSECGKAYIVNINIPYGDWTEAHKFCVECGADMRGEQWFEHMPSAQPALYGYNIEHLELIARVLQKEDLSPERVVEALTNIGGIVAIVRDEFEETLRKAVEECSKNM